MKNAIRLGIAGLYLAAFALAACNEPSQPSNASNAPAVKNSAPTNTAPTNTAPTNTNTTMASMAHLEGADLAKAQQLYAKNCAGCHLASGKGEAEHKKDGIPDFTDAAWHTQHQDAEIKDAIRNGMGKIMPAFKGRLSEADIDLLATYIHGFPERAAAGGPAAPEPHGGHMEGMEHPKGHGRH
jgi:mono/diheme cytochrome c family protein